MQSRLVREFQQDDFSISDNCPGQRKPTIDNKPLDACPLKPLSGLASATLATGILASRGRNVIKKNMIALPAYSFLLVAALVTIALRLAKIGDGRDSTKGADYHADEGDAALRPIAVH